MHKHKSRTGIVHSLKHCFREQETLNADPKRLKDNELQDAKNTQMAMQNYTDRIEGLDRKVRKNAVHAVEFMITASPEKMNEMSRGEQDKFFADSRRFLEDKHGKENIIACAIHRDETTPHMSVFVVPITKDNKLSCKHFYGEQGALRTLQTDFYKEVGIKNDMSRGVEGSKAKHVSIQSYYGRVHNSEKDLDKMKPGLLESKKDYGKRVLEEQGSLRDKYNNLVYKHNDQVREIKALTKERDMFKGELKNVVKKLNLEILNKEDQKQLRQHAYDLAVKRSEQNKIKAEQERVRKEQEKAQKRSKGKGITKSR